MKEMKKILALVLTAVMVLSLAACGSKNAGGESASQSVNGSQSSNTDNSQEPDPGASSAENSSVPEEPDSETNAEALLAQAESVTFEEMAQAAFNDPGNAQTLYCGKVLKVEGSLVNSYFGGLELTLKLNSGSSSAWLVVTLPEEDIRVLEEMSQDQTITIVGVTDEELINEGGGASEPGGASLFTMQTEAYLVK